MTDKWAKRNKFKHLCFNEMKKIALITCIMHEGT